MASHATIRSSTGVQNQTVSIYIPNIKIGAVIGKKHNVICDIIRYSGAAAITITHMNRDELVDRQAHPHHLIPRKITIVGDMEAQWKAQDMIFEKVCFDSYAGPEESSLKVEIHVPSSQVGRIIGKGGRTIQYLQRHSGTIVKILEETDGKSKETPVHIIGDFYSTQAAQREIRALISKSPRACRPSRSKIPRACRPSRSARK